MQCTGTRRASTGSSDDLGVGRLSIKIKAHWGAVPENVALTPTEPGPACALWVRSVARRATGSAAAPGPGPAGLSGRRPRATVAARVTVAAAARTVTASNSAEEHRSRPGSASRGRPGGVHTGPAAGRRISCLSAAQSAVHTARMGLSEVRGAI